MLFRSYRSDGLHCFGTQLLMETDSVVRAKQKGSVEIVIDRLELLPGEYELDVGVISEKNEVYEEIKNVKRFAVTSEKNRIGVCNLDIRWEIDGEYFA